ncbi:sulfite exporter TauE/SafE family protein [Leucobacter luti]|uniref:sulfite exporter TauE/SafE family protein n=1 Tax=Leucobacter luti TaxID=340320 RepID=UPI003D001AE7
MEHLPELAVWAWALLALAALVVGVSKTALPGANTVSIAIFASILPAKSSTGALLLLLIVGDMFALWSYRKHADWPTLVRLAPAVVVGIALGVLFLAVSGDGGVRRVIGAILLLLVGVTLWLRRAAARSGGGSGSGSGTGRLTRAGFGSLAGFTTMVANSGGPVMSMYFLAANFPIKAFLGTAAWFFALVNLSKVPFSIGLGLITVPNLVLDLVLVPGVVMGAFLGRWIAGRIPQRAFDLAILALTVLGALYLLIVP